MTVKTAAIKCKVANVPASVRNTERTALLDILACGVSDHKTFLSRAASHRQCIGLVSLLTLSSFSGTVTLWPLSVFLLLRLPMSEPHPVRQLKLFEHFSANPPTPLQQVGDTQNAAMGGV